MYGRIVAAVRLITKDLAAAEDITQEAFAKTYLSWSKLWPEGNPTGWVYRVATNLAISWHRRAAREVRARARLQRWENTTVAAPEAYPELHRAVESLPPRQRAAVALHYVLGLSMEQAAEAMGCKPGTVKSLLHGARAKLRAQLGEDDDS